MLSGLLVGFILSSCHQKEVEQVKEASEIVVTQPIKRDTLVTREYVCQIHSCRNIEMRALERGYMETISVKEGQTVKEGDLMFNILPLIYQADLKRAEAESQVARVEYENTKRLTDSKVVSDRELAMSKAKLDKTLAEVNLAQTHLGFTIIKAPFAGLMDRLYLRPGSLVEEGDLLTTLSDNSVMWVYFNVPEAEYLDYMTTVEPEERKHVKLLMANNEIFNQPGRVNVIEAEFNNQTGTIPFRADFPNPYRLLRHGGTGNIRMQKMVESALLVPRKATFQILDQFFVFVIEEGDIIRQTRIHISEVLEDMYIVSKGVTDKDKIIFEGLSESRDGAKAKYKFEKPEEAFKNLKLKAE
jgi:membrane fusion protein (multidrug efflux system)